jgi:hypothetical protein
MSMMELSCEPYIFCNNYISDILFYDVYMYNIKKWKIILSKHSSMCSSDQFRI